jgi:competence CoiA-like predicted nuclease
VIMLKLLQYGKDPPTREFISIDNVDRGRGKNLVCPICSNPLVSKKGEVNQWHFAHYQGAECTSSAETYLHFHAKTLFLKAKKIALCDGTIFHFNSARAEAQIDQYRVDVLLENTVNDKKLVVEIVVTNPLT